MPGRDLIVAALTVALLAAGAAAGPAPGGGSLAGDLGARRDPIVVTADALEYDYKSNVVVYRGGVQATQGPVKLRSDTLTVTFAARDGAAAGRREAVFDAPGQGTQRLHEIVAAGNVRIDHGTRWATGGRAVFDQAQRTLVLTESPKLHDGANEVAGDRVVVYLDEDRSVVEGGRRRVKAVLYPEREDGLAPAGRAPPESGDASAAAGAASP